MNFTTRRTHPLFCWATALIAVAGTLALASDTSADISLENFATAAISTAPSPATSFTLDSAFDVGAGDFLVVGVAFEGGSNMSNLTFNGTALTQAVTSNVGGDQTSIFVLAGASGIGALEFTTNADVNFPGFYAASLSGAAGVETTGFDNSGGFGTFNTTITGASDGSYVLGTYADQLGANQFTDATGDLTEVHSFGGASGDIIGSAIGAVVTGFGTGSDLNVSFTDSAQGFQNNAFNNRSNFSYVSIAATAIPEPSCVWVLGLMGLVASRRRCR